MEKSLMEQLDKIAYDKQKAREARSYNGPEDLPHGRDIMSDYEEIMKHNPALRFKVEEEMDQADLREHPDRERLQMADSKSNSAAMKGMLAGGVTGGALPFLAHKRLGGMEGASALAMLLAPLGMIAGGNIGAATQLKNYDGIDIDGIKGEDKNYLRFLTGSIPERTRQDILKQKEVELQERQIKEYERYNRQRIAAELQKAEALRGISTQKTASELVEYLEKVAGLAAEVNAITGKNVDDVTKKLYQRYLSELGILERKPAVEAIKEEAIGSRLTNDAIIQREQRRHAEAVQDATEKAKLGGVIGASVAGFGAGAYGGSKLYDHLTRPQIEEEKVAGFFDIFKKHSSTVLPATPATSPAPANYTPKKPIGYETMHPVALEVENGGYGMSGEAMPDDIDGAINSYQAEGSPIYSKDEWHPFINDGGGNYYMLNKKDNGIYFVDHEKGYADPEKVVDNVDDFPTYLQAELGKYAMETLTEIYLNKTASIARKAVDVLTGKAKADAGQEVLRASEGLQDIVAKRDTVRGAVSDFNNDITAAKDGAKMLEHGQGKKTDLETLLQAARDRKLTAASTGINNRKAGRIDYVTDGELDANNAFTGAKGKYDEYVNELHTRANKPLVDKMTPEFIASQKDDYINRLLGLDKEMGGAQETVKNLQGNYKKQRALQYGSYGALGAGTVAALPKKPNRPYTDDTAAAQTFDPMMYDMGQIEQTAGEDDYFEKLAFAAGLLAAGRLALGTVGRKAGQMGVQNAVARTAGKGVVGDTMGQTLKNVGSRAGGFVGDLTGQTNKVLKTDMSASFGAARKSKQRVGVIDDALEKQMTSTNTNFDTVKKLQNSQIRELQNANDATNTSRKLFGARGQANLAQDKARFGTAVGGTGLMVGNMVGRSDEEKEARKLQSQQQV